MKRKRIKIDNFGRIVIPKKIRNDFGLFPGNELIINESPEGFTLTPAREMNLIEEKEGFLIVNTEKEIDFNKLISNLREDRIKRSIS